jgi:hypothetical protein
MRRDVLTQRDGPAKHDGLNKGGLNKGGLNKGGPNLVGLINRALNAGSFGKPESRPAPDVSVRLEVAAHDEPTWEVRHPNARRTGWSRIDGRTRSILTVAVVATFVANAGAAWTYWKVTGSATGSARAGTAVQLTLRGRSDLNRPLRPGGTGNLTVTLTNDHDFPIRITSVARGAGNVIADDEHRDSGCVGTEVSMAKDVFAVSWDVARNTIGAFTVPDGLRMTTGANQACEGATFTVPVRTTGISERT